MTNESKLNLDELAREKAALENKMKEHLGEKKEKEEAA